MTWASVQRGVREQLADAGHPAADQEALWICEAASGQDRADHLALANHAPTRRQVVAVDAMVGRRLTGEPIQYVLGSWAFRTLDLFVDHRVLIPRPETEVVAGVVLEEVDRRRAEVGRRVVVADLGTGSGAIGLSVVAERDGTDVWLTDASPDALAVARANLAGLGPPATRVTVVEGVWFDALPGDARGTLDVIVSNPPYIAEDEDLPASVVDWEPSSALIAGPTGTEDLEHLLVEAGAWLAPGGALVLESAPDQAEPMAARARREGYVDIEVRQDLAGLDRVVVARTPGSAVDVLAAGGAVVVPTDTVYGLAVRADRPGAVDRLAALKDRAAEQPVAVLVGSVEQAEAVGVLPEWARPLVDRWWPGPLTLVLRRRPGLAWALGDPPDTVGVRLPDHDLVRTLAEAVGPLATTSANRHGEPTPVTAAAAAAALSHRPDLVVDGGPCEGMASTVIDATGDRPVVLRVGPIPVEDLGPG